MFIAGTFIFLKVQALNRKNSIGYQISLMDLAPIFWRRVDLVFLFIYRTSAINSWFFHKTASLK